MCDLSVVLFHLLLWGKKKQPTGNSPLPCPKEYQRIALGMKWSFRKRTMGRWLGRWFFFLPCSCPVLFKGDVLTLVFCLLLRVWWMHAGSSWNISLLSFSFPPLQHCYGNKRKYDFTERNVEVNSEQNEHFGQYPFWKLEIWGFFGEKKSVYVLHHSPPLLDRLPSSVIVEAISNSVLWYALNSWKIILFNAICKRLHTRGLILVDLENNYVNFQIHRIILHFKSSWTFKLLELHSVHSFYLTS